MILFMDWHFGKRCDLSQLQYSTFRQDHQPTSFAKRMIPRNWREDSLMVSLAISGFLFRPEFIGGSKCVIVNAAIKQKRR